MVRPKMNAATSNPWCAPTGHCLEIFAELSFKLGGRACAALAPFELTALEYHQCRYRLHTVSGGQGAILIDIYLNYTGFIAYFGVKFFKHGMHHLAGTAPCSEEVYEHRLLGIDNVFKFFHIQRYSGLPV